MNMPLAGTKRKRGERHPYLTGNFAPIHKTIPLTSCGHTGVIPKCLSGGQYVRNGANPLADSDPDRDAHWFDGDGMLSGVLFESHLNESNEEIIQPGFINQYVQTDLYLSTATTPALRTPILPSIATLVNPASSFIRIILRILRSVFLVFLSHLPGSKHAVRRISAANTGIVYHDGRALATCESGPPIRVQLPELETVGWYDSGVAEGEPEVAEGTVRDANAGVLAFMNEWTTGHPKVDPVTNELILFHSTFLSPYVRYSVTPSVKTTVKEDRLLTPKIQKVPVPGVSGARMMHDFGVSRTHTIIMDLPLSLDPFNLARGKPVVTYDPDAPSRFGVFPRHRPQDVRWFETVACCIFHTANSWDEYDDSGNIKAVHLLACRLTSASLIYSAGNISTPPKIRKSTSQDRIPKGKRRAFSASKQSIEGYKSSSDLESLIPKRHFSEQEPQTLQSTSDLEEDSEQCRLHHYRFSLDSSLPTNQISQSIALSALPIEFPTLRPDRSTRFARYIYGCSTRTATFGAALGSAAKIDVLVKVDVQTLLSRSPSNSVEIDCLDTRNMAEVLASQDPDDPIQAFAMPEGWVAQEAFFVPSNPNSSSVDGSNTNYGSEAKNRDQNAEDNGYLLFYAFDESQLDPVTGEAPPSAVSELWILDARNMRDVVGRVQLPQRVPYGLHGRWFSEEEIRLQRPVGTVIKDLKDVDAGKTSKSGDDKEIWKMKAWMAVRDRFLGLVA